MTFQRRWQSFLWRLGIASTKYVMEDIKILQVNMETERQKIAALRKAVLTLAAADLTDRRHLKANSILIDDHLFREEIAETPIFPYGSHSRSPR
jgi:hypothetical protein